MLLYFVSEENNLHIFMLNEASMLHSEFLTLTINIFATKDLTSVLLKTCSEHDALLISIFAVSTCTS